MGSFRDVGQKKTAGVTAVADASNARGQTSGCSVLHGTGSGFRGSKGLDSEVGLSFGYWMHYSTLDGLKMRKLSRTCRIWCAVVLGFYWET